MPEDIKQTQESPEEFDAKQGEMPAEKHDRKAKKPKTDTAKLAAALENVDEQKAENQKLQEQMLRVTAEYDNYRKRSQKEHDAAFGNGLSHAAKSLLPVLDTLDAAANAPSTDEEYKKGVLMILAKSQEVFAAMGIEEICALDMPFDPELHNACMQEAKDGVESGTVTRVMQKGFTLNGRVVRHAVVAVAP